MGGVSLMTYALETRGEAAMPESARSALPPSADAVAAHGGDGLAARVPSGLLAETRSEGTRTCVTLRGELGLPVDDDLQKILRETLADSIEGIDLDLTGVEFCDCSTLNTLLTVREQALADGKTVTVRAAGPAAGRLLALTGTLTMFTPALAGGGGSDGGLGVEVVQLRRAMQTRPVIDLARGVLMASFGLNPDQAWEVLVAASQNTNTKLHRLADDLVTAVQGDPLPDAVQRQVSAAVARVMATRADGA
ncbi:ANTAR domain-containing protein [Streptomyces flavalbus]|uniref:ANTAR domain-containing protein n=1 Tax=Streptomyces flavalbus TaxID=2665155 RepID=A0ABW2WHF4_9ACTN